MTLYHSLYQDDDRKRLAFTGTSAFYVVPVETDVFAAQVLFGYLCGCFYAPAQ